MTQFIVVFLLAVNAPAFCGGLKAKVIEDHGAWRQQRSLRPPAEETMVRPFRFDQKLLICNAYPSDSPLVVRKNGQEAIADAKHAIKFRECRYITSRVQPRDKLDLLLRDVELHGTFEVGDLPATDAVLLLVFEKRENSPLVAFQSFAFPTSSDSKDAQLAVIDTFKGNASNAPSLLRMEDHITGKEEQTVSKRVEQLSFNRVYSVEAGTYDASVSKRLADAMGKQASKMVLQLQKSQNYVLLRTGDDAHFGETLVVYPDATPLPSGACAPASILAWLAACVAAAVATM